MSRQETERQKDTELRLKSAEFLMKATQQQGAALGQLLDNTEKLSARLADATEEEREQAIRGLTTFATQQGMSFIIPTIPALVRSPDLSHHLGAAYQFMKDRPGAHAFIANIADFRKDPAGFMDKFRGFAAREATREILARLPGVVSRLQPGEGGQIAFNDVAALIAPGLDRASEFLRDVFTGGVESPKEVRGALDSALARHGVELSDVAARAHEAAATTKATRLAEASPEVTTAQTAAATVKKKAELAPEIVALEAQRATALTDATERAKAKFDIDKPLSATEAGTMRSQFLAQSKDFADTIRAYQRVEDSAKAPSAAGDLAMIFSYMKMLDPGSAVREGEQATAASARGVPDAVRSMYNRLLSGERLGPEQRLDFANRARMLMKGQLEQHEQLEGEFKRIAGKRHGDPGDVVPDLVGRLRQTIKQQRVEAPAPEALSRKSQDYKAARARGLSDGEIERRYNIKLMD